MDRERDDVVDREAGLATRAMDQAAIVKAGNIETWQPYIYEKVEGGLLITGCRTRPKKSGPNKGDPMFLTDQDRRRVIVTKDDIDAQLRLILEAERAAAVREAAQSKRH